MVFWGKKKKNKIPDSAQILNLPDSLGGHPGEEASLCFQKPFQVWTHTDYNMFAAARVCVCVCACQCSRASVQKHE